MDLSHSLLPVNSIAEALDLIVDLLNLRAISVLSLNRRGLAIFHEILVYLIDKTLVSPAIRLMVGSIYINFSFSQILKVGLAFRGQHFCDDISQRWLVWYLDHLVVHCALQVHRHVRQFITTPSFKS